MALTPERMAALLAGIRKSEKAPLHPVAFTQPEEYGYYKDTPLALAIDTASPNSDSTAENTSLNDELIATKNFTVEDCKFTAGPSIIPAVQIQLAEPTIDPRIKYLSYSSSTLLHTCPRKYELYKLGHYTEQPADPMGQLTFTFGHAVGNGIGYLFQGCSMEQVVWNTFLEWGVDGGRYNGLDIMAENTKQNKSFFLAINALQKFEAMMQCGYLQDYELVYYTAPSKNGSPECVVPAIELSFRIQLPDGFIYRGHVDVILRHKVTKKITVIECKTDSSYTIAAAKYKNSSQAIGYSVVLDVIEPEASAYDVLYLVYNTKKEEWTPLEFSKSHLQRALWIQELLLDVEMIKLYERTGVYPKHGESCHDFFRDCENLATCTLSTQYLAKPYIPEEDAELKKDYLFTFTLEEIITGQLSRHQE